MGDKVGKVNTGQVGESFEWPATNIRERRSDLEGKMLMAKANGILENSFDGCIERCRAGKNEVRC